MQEPIDHILTPERKVYGQHETIELPVASFVRLPQVRSGLNPELPALKASIWSRGLLNQIDVARMTEDQLRSYIDFINRTWKTTVTLEDYGMMQQADDYYYVVVAGHTRTEAVFQLQEEDGTGREHSMIAKVHPISSPQELISLQLDENIHSKPAQEQRAIAIVETYMYGIENGLWKDKSDFLRKAGADFNRQILNEAMGFAQLPPEARDFVFSGRLSYNAGVALGMATDTILEYIAMRMGNPDLATKEAKEHFETLYRYEIGILTAHISNHNLNGTAAKKYIAGQVGVKREKIDEANAISDDEAMLFTMVDPSEERVAYENGLKREYAQLLRELTRTSIDSAASLLSLHHQLLGDAGAEAVRQELSSRQQRFGESVLGVTFDTAGAV